MEIPELTSAEAAERLERFSRRPAPACAFYSSLLGGIVTDPRYMQIPVDDHLVHRGDGLFETCACRGGVLYNLPAHLDRLERSAAALQLRLPINRADWEPLVRSVLKAGGRPDLLLRILVSRGPGGFSVDPGECPEPAVYVIAYPCPPPFMDSHPEGARVISGSRRPKHPELAQIKSCNYITNALLKNEAASAGAHFALGFDEEGHLAEAPTENAALVVDNQLLFPAGDRKLEGTTLKRVQALLEAHTPTAFEVAETRPVHRDELPAADEILLFGTTTEVTAVTNYNGNPVSSGQPGPVYRELAELLQRDMAENEALRLRV